MWKEVAKGIFQKDNEIHQCNAVNCIATMETVSGGMEICSISGMKIGFALNDNEIIVDDYYHYKRILYTDPQNVLGHDDKMQIGIQICERIFHKYLISEKDLADKQRKSLMVAKNNGVNLQLEGKRIKEEIKEQHITMSEIKTLCEEAIGYTLNLKCDYESILCALLYLYSSDGLKVNGIEYIKPNMKLHVMFPHVRTLEQFGIKPSVVGIGVNAITSSVVNQPKKKMLTSLNELIVTKKRTRVHV